MTTGTPSLEVRSPLFERNNNNNNNNDNDNNNDNNNFNNRNSYYSYYFAYWDWGRTVWRHSLPREVGRFRPAESVVATLASTNKPTATSVSYRVTAQARYGAVKT